MCSLAPMHQPGQPGAYPHLDCRLCPDGYGTGAIMACQPMTNAILPSRRNFTCPSAWSLRRPIMTATAHRGLYVNRGWRDGQQWRLR